MKRFVLGIMAAVSAVCFLPSGTQAQSAPPPRALVWAPKPQVMTPYKAPNQPLIKLSELLAKHRGQASWTELLGQDGELRAEYIQMAPGEKTKTQMLADQRLGIIVWQGQIRVAIDGQEPFIASKGYMIQVPFRVPYSLETVGDTPSLRFEVKPAASIPIYPASETPPPAPAGQIWYKASVPGRDTYERQNSKPYLDFLKEAAKSPGPKGTFIRDDRNYFNVIRGPAVPRPSDTVKGHFHAGLGEFWFIMEGQISFLIEGEPYFVANPGDIVYAPPGRFHRPLSAGTGMATRIAILGYPYNAHFYNPDEAPE